MNNIPDRLSLSADISLTEVPSTCCHHKHRYKATGEVYEMKTSSSQSLQIYENMIIFKPLHVGLNQLVYTVCGFITTPRAHVQIESSRYKQMSFKKWICTDWCKVPLIYLIIKRVFSKSDGHCCLFFCFNFSSTCLWRQRELFLPADFWAFTMLSRLACCGTHSLPAYTCNL